QRSQPTKRVVLDLRVLELHVHDAHGRAETAVIYRHSSQRRSASTRAAAAGVNRLGNRELRIPIALVAHIATARGSCGSVKVSRVRSKLLHQKAQVVVGALCDRQSVTI